MWEIHDLTDTRRSKFLLGLSICCAVLSAILFQFLYELCHAWIPLTYIVILIPVVGSIAGFICLFDPQARIVAVIGKLVVIAANIYHVGAAGIAMTGLGLFRCNDRPGR